ncbi:MAG: 50S ribosomal protein L21 [Rhizobiaceae bacterium]
MFAVIKTGGKQYRVAANEKITIERLAGEVGDIIEFGHVMMVGTGADAAIGAPFVEGALVTGEITDQHRAAKVITFKKRRRQNSRRTIGHRQLLTTVVIAEILTGGAKPSKAAKPAKAADAGSSAPAALMSAPAAEKPAKKAAKAADGVKDDVALIGGIGPVLKKKLAGAGITTLSQIAAMSADELAKLDADLDLGGRSDTEEWIEQAKELLAGKPPRAKVDQKAAKGE